LASACAALWTTGIEEGATTVAELSAKRVQARAGAFGRGRTKGDAPARVPAHRPALRRQCRLHA
jgi:hypothetical protein